MSLDYQQAYDHARPERPFSNGTEGYGWMDNWCSRCVHDHQMQMWEAGKITGDMPSGCPLILVALMDRTPAEWLPQRDEHGRYSIADQYHCIEFRDVDDGPGPEPQPVPDPPGQEALLPREDYEGVRMLTALPERQHTHV